MRANYSRVLQHIGNAIRQGDSDQFSAAHLESWVVGSEKVVRATQAFLIAKTEDEKKIALSTLVRQMRSDVGLSEVDTELKIDGVFRREGGFDT